MSYVPQREEPTESVTLKALEPVCSVLMIKSEGVVTDTTAVRHGLTIVT